MNELIATLNNILQEAQLPAMVVAGLATIGNGFYFMVGGSEAAPKAKKNFLYISGGFIIIMGATAFIETLNSAMAF